MKDLTSSQTDAQRKARVLVCLAHIYKDFGLLIDGEWEPDEDSCESSQDLLLEAVRLLRETGALPPTADLIKAVGKLR